MRQTLFFGRSKIKKILENSSSGGIISSILVYLFEQKKIDSALVSNWDPKKLELKGKIITNAKEVPFYAQSKYLKSDCTQKIIELISSQKKFAIVGSPCYIKIAKNLIKTKHIPKNNYYLLGLFCNHPITKEGLDFIFYKHQIDKKQIKKITFRGRKKWDSQLRIKLKNNQTVSVPISDTWGGLWGAGFFTPTSCLACPNYLPTDADIAIGDAWGSGFKQKTAIIIAKNQKALDLLKAMQKEKILWLKKATKKNLNKGHRHNITFKKARAAVTRKDKKIYPYGVLDWFLAKIFSTAAFVSKSKKNWPLLKKSSLASRAIIALTALYYRGKNN